MFEGKHITLIVSGSVASYKAATLARELQRAGAQVRVILTTGAAQFVTAATFAALTKTTVLTDDNWWQADGQIRHIEWADWTDLLIAAPASANLMAQLANGLANDAASATWLAAAAPKVVVPAMNTHMWQAPATQRNRQQLMTDGAHVLTPATGVLAEGYSGQGRFLAPAEIVRQLADLPLFTPQTLAGKRVIVTAGGTRERLDPVRFLTNDSSGKMGYAVAAAAQQAGAKVTLITAPTGLSAPSGVDIVNIQSTTELATAVLDRFPNADVLVMAAAVADFQPVTVADQKIKKTADNDEMVLTLKKTPDILKQVAAIKQPHQVTVGFAAETQAVLANGQKKLADKQLDLLAANDVSRQDIGFNSDDNQVTFIMPDGVTDQTPKTSKRVIAQALVSRVATILAAK
ncbi:bifunctional phosphopantothenoylcysteine decarboxylase/phosphopantothenate--cysteine ligase CoaBC [Levilactobacillus brevis]|uniref:bifunctional phosphopantothenoylcysteine decarboxylase/phosphopantothenate--cysteine ligase CoaBC n=1 Tax=Levilactobacillus brevis TaxID=1580 RepID=UPI0011420F0F|nr:bifunctional phosphopantothenoylcysteine decarboxylase/phosphopantothenate--cysteine ligase CoaBC [Levilactobacillus brevis]MBU7539900.1 bifunctional phosphopantothenoylcysteine decarboxylase/phosphopantothenate--cysteine ligase CoaBC [Levilactobacillus brevis]MBU7559516.1 bifunctional phosphopantothenoylcysteine decarboxylase/phosphopantothenate--cysteine ligase CoaBC [Levilactobacillus brevis]MBU7566022.1 bifunctional phosphopantothenoylcysteine decarboxylase/phosphopantothenate--cysteine l